MNKDKKFVITKTEATGSAFAKPASSNPMTKEEFITKAGNEVTLHWKPFNQVTGIFEGNTITWDQKIFTKIQRTASSLQKVVDEEKKNVKTASAESLADATHLLNEAMARFTFEASKCIHASAVGEGTNGYSSKYVLGHYLSQVKMNQGCNQLKRPLPQMTVKEFAKQWVPYMGCVANCEPNEEIACNTFMHLRNNDARSKTGNPRNPACAAEGLDKPVNPDDPRWNLPKREDQREGAPKLCEDWVAFQTQDPTID